MKIFKTILGVILLTQVMPLMALILYFAIHTSFVGFWPVYYTILTYGNIGVLIVFAFAYSIIKLFDNV